MRVLFDLSAIAIRAWYRLKADIYYRALFRRFGQSSVLRRPLLIAHPEHIEIGARVFIREGARLEAILDGVNAPLLRIGDDTSIEQNVHIVCHCRVQIGARVSITPSCVIVDTIHPFEGLPAGSKIGKCVDTTPSYVEIGDGSFLGAGAMILPNVTIGEGAIIGAGAVVTGDIPARAVVAGNPARVLRIYK